MWTSEYFASVFDVLALVELLPQETMSCPPVIGRLSGPEQPTAGAGMPWPPRPCTRDSLQLHKGKPYPSCLAHCYDHTLQGAVAVSMCMIVSLIQR